MAESLVWGSFGDVVFEFLTSPARGTVRRGMSAKFNERSRIISRSTNGILAGQKPLKDLSGLKLDTVSFSCKISAIVLKSLSLSTGETLALAAGVGPLVGTSLGDTNEDKRFFTDIKSFIDTLTEINNSQDPHPLTIGSEYIGLYTLDSLGITETHRTNGERYTAEIDISLSEWVEK